MPDDGASDDYLSAVVHQATGMVAVQAGCDVTEALNRMRIRAEATDQTLENTALDVIDRVIRFDE
jgi:AmiR/NasT family two-component response regulator